MSKAARAVWKRKICWSHGSASVSDHFCFPSAIESAQSIRSPMWARISAGVRIVGPAWNPANSAGAPRSALPAR